MTDKVTTPDKPNRVIKARYLTASHLLVLDADKPVDRDGDTVLVQLAGGATVEYGVEEGVTVANPVDPDEVMQLVVEYGAECGIHSPLTGRAAELINQIQAAVTR